MINHYRKMCADRNKALGVLRAIVDMWHGIDVDKILRKFKDINLPDYPLEYILYALEWILEQEDINFTGIPQRKQDEIDKILKTLRIETPKGRLGSQLAIALLCDVFLGTHPVEALLKANLDIRPRR